MATPSLPILTSLVGSELIPVESMGTEKLFASINTVVNPAIVPGPSAAKNDVTLYQDLTHPTQLGDNYLKNTFKPTLFRILNA